MAGACVNDTNSVVLSYNDDDELEADVRYDPTGPLEDSAAGVTIDLHQTMEVISGELAVNYQGSHLSHDANGLTVIHSAGVTGTVTGSGDTSNHNAAINRGVTAAISPTLSISLINPTTRTLTFHVIPHWEGDFQTNFPALDGFGNIVDAVTVVLQESIDGGAFANICQDSLRAYNMAAGFMLEAHRFVAVTSGDTRTYQARLATVGAATSGTARQGVLNRTFRRNIQIYL